MTTFDFTGKAVLVFGGTSGINLGIAQAFAAAGAWLGVASRHQAKVDAAVSLLSDQSDRVKGFRVDVATPRLWRGRPRPSRNDMGRPTSSCQVPPAISLPGPIS